MMAYLDYVEKKARPNHMLETAMILDLPAQKISLTDNIQVSESLTIPEIYLTKL